MAWTTTDLLSTIRNRQMLPDASTGSLSSPALLQFGTEYLHLQLMAMILKLRERYYATSTDTAYSTSTPYIAIPSRAIGGVIDSVQFVDSEVVRNLNPIDPATIATRGTDAQPRAFYFENNRVYFYPAPSTAQGTVCMRWFQRPSRLAATSACAQITAFNAGTGVVTLTPVSTWTTSDLFDFIPQDEARAMPYGIDSAISAVSTTTMTFSSLPSAVAVGDWVAPAGYTPIPEIPFELQGVLAAGTAATALEAMKDPALDKAMARLKLMMEAAIDIMTPRAQASTKRIVSNWRNW